MCDIYVVKYYTKRWKIEQMIKDLKQRLGFADYQVRDLYAVQRHVVLAFRSYFVLIFLKVLQLAKGKDNFLKDLSIQRFAFHLRKHILLENISVTLKNMRIQFKQDNLDTIMGLKSARPR